MDKNKKSKIEKICCERFILNKHKNSIHTISNGQNVAIRKKQSN